MNLSKVLTNGGDDGTSEEEGATLVPVAGVVGRVFERTHAGAHGINGVLRKRRGERRGGKEGGRGGREGGRGGG